METEVKRLMAGRETETERDGGGFGGGLVLNESLAVMFDFLPNSLQSPRDTEQLRSWKSHRLAGRTVSNMKSCADCCHSPNPSCCLSSFSSFVPAALKNVLKTHINKRDMWQLVKEQTGCFFFI